MTRAGEPRTMAEAIGRLREEVGFLGRAVWGLGLGLWLGLVWLVILALVLFGLIG